MILPANCHTRCVPTRDAVFTLPVLVLVAVIDPKVPEVYVSLGVARFMWFPGVEDLSLELGVDALLRSM